MTRFFSYLLLFTSFAITATPSRLALSDYFTETWSTRSGLPHNSINSVAQTADGYLWVATWEGLARFNGREFKLFTRTEIVGLPDSGLRSLISQPNGELYIAGARGGISLRKAGRWQTLSSAKAMVNHLLKTRSGQLWLALEGQGVVYRQHDSAVEHQVLTDVSAYRLVEDQTGTIWAATSDGLYKIRAGKAVKVPSSSGLPNTSVYTLLLTKSGTLLVGTEQGAWQFNGKRFESINPVLSNQSISSLLEDSQGDLWFGTINNGVFRLSELGLEQLDADAGLPANRILSLLQDREQSIWVGTNAGLFRLREAPFTNWTKKRGLAGDYIRSILAHSDSSIWVGSSSGLNRINDNQSVAVQQADNTEPLSVLSLAEAENGQVWVGTYTSGLMKVVNNQIFPVKDRTNGLLSNEVRALLFDSKNRLWIGSANGLSTLNEDGQLSVYSKSDGLVGNFIMALSEDSYGNIWIGTGVGVTLYNATTHSFRTLTFPEQFSAEYAFGFYQDGNTMWMATDRGLIRYHLIREEMQLFGREQGLPVDKLFQIVEQDQSLWLTSNRGVIQVNKAQLNNLLDNPQTVSNASVSLQIYDEADGMLSAQANGGSNPAATIHQDERLWVATAKGAAVITPKRLKEASQLSLPTVIEGFFVDGKAIDLPVAGDVLELPAGISRVSFHYAGLSFIMPQRLNYQTQLSGFNNQWLDRSQLTITEYTNLPPGEYTFKVRAGYPNSEWQNNEQTLRFKINSFFWQKMSFKLMMFIGFILLGYLLYKYRLYHYKRIEIELTEKVAQQVKDLKKQADAFAYQANHDQLTQLPNRRSFDLWLSSHFAEFKRDNKILAIAIIDIDHFKSINDNWSHMIGDKVICEIAELLKSAMLHREHIARWGGEEFTLLFPNCSALQAQQFCENVRQTIAAHDFSAIAENLHVTVSFGVTDSRQVNDYDRLLAHADQALYQAKSNGRNRVEVLNASAL
ncbi:two-component regulator propeller domain-containing protein [Pseudoalteromonas mariniglutinosa]|uniref:two-component regulator propeller domain-containing protein n=1 Tax=Pseudoalteromonas mariniglutinosa TaxID=206042 RepID=UPI0038504AFA